MKADKELTDYIRLRYRCAKKSEEENEPNGDDRFKHIYHMGEAAAFREVLSLLEDSREELGGAAA